MAFLFVYALGPSPVLGGELEQRGAQAKVGGVGGGHAEVEHIFHRQRQLQGGKRTRRLSVCLYL
jgi:hypothetical protein